MCWDESVELSATYIGGSVFPSNSPALQLVAINFTNQASLTVNSFGVTAGLRSLSIQEPLPYVLLWHFLQCKPILQVLRQLYRNKCPTLTLLLLPPDIFKSPAMTASSPIVSNNPVQKKIY
jgi:hypothetical protein